MKYEYIFYETDESFNYLGAFGTQTQYETGLHGFKIEIDAQGHIDISTLSGFGHFGYDITKKCKTLQDLYNYIEENKCEIVELNEDCKYTRLELLEELQEMILKAVSAKQAA